MASECQPGPVDADIDGASDSSGNYVAHPLGGRMFLRCRKREMAVGLPGNTGRDDERQQPSAQGAESDGIDCDIQHRKIDDEAECAYQ